MVKISKLSKGGGHYINHLYEGIIYAVLCCFVIFVAAQPSHSKTLLELYTAQGCVPCQKPGKLASRVDEGKNFISLEFHVDYLDELGWADPFAKQYFSVRHRRYIERLAPAFANLPQIVINGFNVSTGINAKDAVEKLKKAREKLLGMGITLSLIKISNAGIEVDIKNPNDVISEFDIFVARYLIKKTTRVLRGELEGKVIDSHNVVIDLEKAGKWNGKTERRTIMTNIKPKSGEGIVVFLQEKNLGFVVAADNYEIETNTIIK